MKSNLSHEELVRLYRTLYILGDSSVLKILYELDRYGERNFTELKRELGINPSTLTKKLQMLTQVGIVGSDRTHDNLRVYYSIAHHHKVIQRLIEDIEKLAKDL